ncbi:MAG TPA: hypothetical protein VI410_08340, partial [Anaerolineales bacterium]|nr:hypothetical protein [Anaerolineales bacterium]
MHQAPDSLRFGSEDNPFVAAAIHPAEQQDPLSSLSPTPGIGLQGRLGRLAFQGKQRVIRRKVQAEPPRPPRCPVEPNNLDPSLIAEISGASCTSAFTIIGYAQRHEVEQLGRVSPGQVVRGREAHDLT